MDLADAVTKINMQTHKQAVSIKTVVNAYQQDNQQQKLAVMRHTEEHCTKVLVCFNDSLARIEARLDNIENALLDVINKDK